MIEVKVFHKGNTFLRMKEWLDERNIPLDLGPNISKEFIEKMIERIHKWPSGKGVQCDIFYFERLEDAMLFKLSWSNND